MGCCFGNNRDAISSPPGAKRDESPLISINSPIRSPRGDLDIRNVLSKLQDFNRSGDEEGVDECLDYITELSKKGHGEKLLQGMQYIGFKDQSAHISAIIKNMETPVDNMESLKSEKNTQDPSEHTSSDSDDSEGHIKQTSSQTMDDAAFVWKAPPKYLMQKTSPEIIMLKKKSQFFKPQELLGGVNLADEPSSESD